MKTKRLDVSVSLSVDVPADLDTDTPEGEEQLRDIVRDIMPLHLADDFFVEVFFVDDEDEEIDEECCESCGNPFADFGNGQRSAVDPSVCSYCYCNPDDEEADDTEDEE